MYQPARYAGDIGFQLAKGLHRTDDLKHLRGQLDEGFIGDKAFAVDKFNTYRKSNTSVGHFCICGGLRHGGSLFIQAYWAIQPYCAQVLVIANEITVTCMP